MAVNMPAEVFPIFPAPAMKGPKQKPPPGSPANKGVKDTAKQPGSPAMNGTNKRQSKSPMRRPASSPPRKCPKRENSSSPMERPAAVEQDKDDKDEKNEDDEKAAARAR